MDLSNSLTTTGFLQGLLETDNEEVWRQFDARYRPIVVAVARRLGLSPEDADDVAQQTLLEVVRDYRLGRYVRGQGRLRSWIVGIARHRIADVGRARARAGHLRGDSALALVPEPDQIDSIWEKEQQRVMLEEAMAELQRTTRAEPRTMRAFELVARGGATVEFVANECGLAVADIYRIKNRLTIRLRAIVERLDALYADEA